MSPLIGVTACRKQLLPHFYHVVGEKYIDAVIDGAGGLPLLIPAGGERLPVAELIARLDGLLLTGSHSNIEPHHYQGAASEPDTLHDPHRDATTLPLIRAAIDAGLPLFAICRGSQEVNVAYGGSLHQRVHEQPGMLDHREDPEQPLSVQYGPAHPLQLAPGGLLMSLLDTDLINVNSVHWQGVDRLGEGLIAEAIAPDGLIEAFRVEDAPGFNLAVQWHPEWRAVDNPVSMALFGAFGAACRAYQERRYG